MFYNLFNNTKIRKKNEFVKWFFKYFLYYHQSFHNSRLMITVQRYERKMNLSNKKGGNFSPP
jgi:hypothetical protein